MAAQMIRVTVADAVQLEQAVNAYIGNGFVVANRTADSVTMFKKKEFSVLWAVVGLVLCVLPLLIYLIVYASQSDEMVEIRVVHAWAGVQGILSADGRWRWNGRTWEVVPIVGSSGSPPPAPPPPPAPA